MGNTYFVAATLLLLGTAGSWADEAEDAFRSLYGNEYDKAVATADKADDVALAAQLLAAAKAPGTNPALSAVLFDKAYELGSKAPAGFETAVEAMEILAERTPAKASACWERIVALRQKQYETARGAARPEAAEGLVEALLSSGDAKLKAGASAEASAPYRRALSLAGAINSERKPEILARLDTLAARQKLEKQAADLKARLEADSSDAATRMAVLKLHLVDLDDPATAATFLDESCDAATRKYLPSVAKGAEGAPELACVELAEWYRSLGEGAAPAAKAAMFLRARAYYTRFLLLHKADDLARNHASLAMKKMDDTLAALGSSAGATRPGIGPGRWVDLLKLVDRQKDWKPDLADDVFEMKDASLRLATSGSSDRVTVPCIPAGNYELEVRFAQSAVGKGRYVFFALPAGTSSVALKFGDTEFGDLANAKPAPGRAAASGRTVGAECVARVRVLVTGQEAEISVQVNDKPNIQWRGPLAALSIGEANRPANPACVGLGVFWTDAVFRSARLRMISGTARLLR